ncbi:MAG TPA: GNAT family N-acetyltransferase [Vicinamibacterales bacterium]|nr:GNAT family N-acetyltransferase [Vicinamibacterales bacterium]
MILRTARLGLRELTAEDGPFILALLNDPGFIEHIGDRGVRSIADAVSYIERGPRASYAQHGFGLWLVELSDTSTPIGICGILKRDVLPDPDIGFAFLPDYRSRGFAYEAAAAVRDFARQTLRLPRLLAIVSPANGRSIRLLQRLGFAFERTMTVPNDAQELQVFAGRL